MPSPCGRPLHARQARCPVRRSPSPARGARKTPGSEPTAGGPMGSKKKFRRPASRARFHGGGPCASMRGQSPPPRTGRRGGAGRAAAAATVAPVRLTAARSVRFTAAHGGSSGHTRFRLCFRAAHLQDGPAPARRRDVWRRTPAAIRSPMAPIPDPAAGGLGSLRARPLPARRPASTKAPPRPPPSAAPRRGGDDRDARAARAALRDRRREMRLGKARRAARRGGGGLAAGARK